ncbi:MAG TPA: alkaline phosphatase family protein [Solirubrobacteraceae bacterium]|nr:alkaline phosphatase family protein [Solirubrobacteraceae bacterium]
MWGEAERAALRGVAHLLPERLRQVIDVAAADVPPAPSERIPAPDDPAAARLNQIEHIVVVMLENRSFDHMLGYLSLPEALGGRARTDIDGLRGPDVNFNEHGGQRYPIHHLDRTEFRGEAEDPDHSGKSVDQQLSGGGQGFVENFARISAARAAKLGVPVPDPGLVMGYYDADDLPVYDHLAAEYCVVDRWFSSVPGATWPNRLYAMCGQADAKSGRDDASPPLYALPSFVRYLDSAEVDWRWYSFDPGTLRAADPEYRLSHHDHFGYVDARKLSIEEEVIGKLTEKGSFLDDVAAGKLPAVSWIDPHFKDLKVLGPDSNDDHPPSDVIAGQDLVLTVYHALSSNSATWPKTLLIITYDEHGGFYDHVAPPPATDDHPDFRRLGVRVPALLVSPLVKPGSTASTLLPAEFHFDHTSIIKTIFTRFCQRDGQIPRLTARVGAANHLGHLLSDGTARADLPDHSGAVQTVVDWRTRFAQIRFADPVATAAPPRELTDFQNGFYEMARLLRQAGLPGGHP